MQLARSVAKVLGVPEFQNAVFQTLECTNSEISILLSLTDAENEYSGENIMVDIDENGSRKGLKSGTLHFLQMVI